MISAPLAASDYSTLVMSHSPVAYWRLGESSGTTAVDETASHNGTYQNDVTLGAEGAGIDEDTSAHFGGDSDDRVTVPSFDVSGSAVTLMGWFNVDSFNDQRIVSKATGEQVADHYWMLGINGTNTVRFRIKSGGTTTTTYEPTIPSLSAGNWYFLAATYDGTNMSVYLNGVLIGTQSKSGTIDSASGVDVAIGNQPLGAGDRAFDGRLDEVAVIDQALTAIEIEELYNLGAVTKRLLFVTETSTLSTQETLREQSFESWGYQVDTIEDSESEANFLTALEDVDVVYVAQSADEGSLAYKLRTTKKGIVHEGVSSWDDNVGWTTSTGGNANTCSTMTVIDNTHPITKHFSTGTVSIFSSSSGSNGSQVISTIASGAQQLGSNRCINSGNANLLYLDVSAALANTYNGNSIASGRRVRLPYGGFGMPDWSNLTSDGLTLVENALEWASGSDLLLHWRLDETSGLTATDSSVYRRDGAVSGSPTWETPARRSTGMTFETSDGADVITGPNIEIEGDELTLAVWFKLDQLLNDSRLIMHSSGNSGSQQGWGLSVDDNGAVEFRVNAGGTWHRYTLSSTVEPGGWYHLVGVYDAGEMRVYLDGVLIGTDNHSAGGDLTVLPSAVVTVGDSPIGSRSFDGDIDDVRVYGKALSEAEIAEVYGLIGHWKLDEDSGTVATDSSGAANDGSYEGGSAPGANGPYPGAGANAAEFEGNNGDKIALPTMNYDFSDGITMAIWYNPNAITGSYTDFISLSNGSLIDDIWLGFDNTKGLDLFLSDTADGAAFRGLIENDGAPPLDVWQHVVAVIDSEGDATLYRNGQAVATGYTGLPRDIERTDNGIAETTFEHALDGELHDARLYNRALSSEEVADIYGLVGHWKLDETSGTTAYDSSGMEDHGAHNGGVSINVAGSGSGELAVAAEYDGIDEDTDLPARRYDFSRGFATSMWVKATQTLTAYSPFINLANGANQEEIWVGWVNSSVGFQLYLSDTVDGSSLKTIEDNQDFAANSWVHFIAMVDEDGNATLYRDGIETKSGFNTSLPKSVNRSLNRIANSVYVEHVPAAMQDVRVYNRPLSNEEIESLSGGVPTSGLRIMSWTEIANP